MAFSYDDAAIGQAASVSRLRFLVGDTTEYIALLTDGEAQYLLTTYATADAACVPALDAMIRKQAQLADGSSGSESIQHSKRLGSLRRLRDEMVAAGWPAPTTSPAQLSRSRTLGRAVSEGSTEWA